MIWTYHLPRIRTTRFAGVTRKLNQKRLLQRLVIFLLVSAASFSCLVARGQEQADFDREDVDVSYIYAAIMGSGTYKIKDRRITMLRFPFSFTQQHLTEEKPGLKWYAPVVVGYDAVEVGDRRARVFDDELVTLSVLPGFEYQWPLDETWAIKPFGHLGVTRDFTLDETVLMSVLGVRLLGTWHRGDRTEIRWGAALRLGAEHQLDSDVQNEFSLWETCVDFRRKIGLRFLEREVNAGVYYRLQYFFPDWSLAEPPIRGRKVDTLHELGLSIGLKTPRKILGFSFSRVRVGYKRGDGFEGWTFGTEFPI